MPLRRKSIRERVSEIAARLANPPTPVPKDALFLGRRPATDESVYILPQELDTHLHVIGGSRRGKTNALRHLANQLLKRRKSHGEGFAIIDPHGGLARFVVELCASDPAVADDVLYLSLKDTKHVLCLNPVHRTGQDPYFVGACVREALIKVFDRTRSQDKKSTARVLTNLGQALNEQGLTLLESRYFLNRGEEDLTVLASIVAEMPSGDLRSYWEHHLRRTPHDAEVQNIGPANRLDDLIRPAVLRRMLGQTHASVDFLELMNRGGVALFDTSLGENTEITTDGQDLLNALLVQQFRQAYPRRKEKGDRDYDPKKWPPFTLILDEFGSYCSAEFARTLTEASKFGLRAVFAHQNLQQLQAGEDDHALLSAVLAIPNKVVFGNLPYDEAETLAKHIYLGDLNPDEIKYQGETVTWDPVLKWGVTGRSRSRSVTHEPTRRSVATDRTRGRTEIAGTTIDPDTDKRTEHESSADQFSERYAETVSTADGPVESEGTVETEGLFVDHKIRKQKQPPIYRSVEEQVFKAAQRLAMNPRGVCVVAREEHKPTLCLVPSMDKRPATEEERRAFLQLVYRQPVYLASEEATTQIDDRQKRLVSASHVQILASSAPRTRAAAGGRKARGGASQGTPLASGAREHPAEGGELPDLLADYMRLGLPEPERLEKRLQQARRTFAARQYFESCANSRVVIERVFQRVALAHAEESGKPFERPPGMKDALNYLDDNDLLDQPTWKMCAEAYSQQSRHVHDKVEETEERALLLLNQSVALSHFVLQRFAAWRSNRQKGRRPLDGL